MFQFIKTPLILGLSGLILFLNLSCTRQNGDPSKGTLVMSFPKIKTQLGSSKISESVSLQATATTNNEWGIARPGSLSEVACYALFIGKSKVKNTQSCVDSNGSEKISYYMSKGLFKPGETVSLDVEIGATDIFVVGLNKKDASLECSDLSKGVMKRLFSQPIILGQTSAQILGQAENTVEINIDVQSNNVALEKCSGFEYPVDNFVPDTTPPTLSSPTLAVSASTINSITLNWKEASDSQVKSSLLQYRIFRSEAGIKDPSFLSSLLKAEGATPVTDWISPQTSKIATGLNPGTSYVFVLVVKDLAGNKSIYLPVVGTTLSSNSTNNNSNEETDNSNPQVSESDSVAPTMSSPTVSVANPTANSVVLNWLAASDNLTESTALKYRVYRSYATTNDLTLLNTVQKAEAEKPLNDWTAQIKTLTVTGLNSNSPYVFAVVVKDTAGNKSLYTPVMGTTLKFIEFAITNPVANVILTPTQIQSLQLSGNCPLSGQTIQLKVGSTATNCSTQCTSNIWQINACNLSNIQDGNLSLSVDDGNATSQSVVVIKDLTPPEIPTNLRLTDEVLTTKTSSPSIYWNSSSDGSSGSGLASYKIQLFQKNTSGGVVTETAVSDLITAISGYTFYNLNLTYGSNYFVKLKAIDRAGNESAFVSSATWLVSDPNAPAIGLIVEPVYPSNGAKWNDYVSYTDLTKDRYHQADIACAGTEDGYYGEFSGCVHAGEMKKVILSAISSCSGLTMLDTQGLFDWKCMEESGKAIFYTSGLFEGKGLRDLIGMQGGTAAWIQNRVILKSNGTEKASSTLATWWNNSLLALPGSSTQIVSLNANAGTIYYANSTYASKGYVLDSSNLGIVTLGTNELKFNGNSTMGCSIDSGGLIANGLTVFPLICTGSASAKQKFFWIEVNLNGNKDSNTKTSTGIMALNWKFSRIHKTRIVDLKLDSTVEGSAALYLRGAKSNLITQLEGYSAGLNGIDMVASSSNTFKKIALEGVFSTFINLKKYTMIPSGALPADVTSNKNKFYDLFLSNSVGTVRSFGVHLSASSQNVFSRVNISNIIGSNLDTPPLFNASEGVYIEGESATYVSQKNIFNQLTINGTQHSGVALYNYVQNNLFSHTTIVNTYGKGVYLRGNELIGNIFNSTAILNTDKAIKVLTSTGGGNMFFNLAARTYSSSGYVIDNTIANLINVMGYLLRAPQDSCSDSSLNTSCQISNQGSMLLTTSDLGAANWANAIVGPINASDSTNSKEDNLGKSSFNSLVSLDLSTWLTWFSFDNIWRSWGKADLLDSTSRKLCDSSSSVCQIWDLRAKNSPESALYNKSVKGNLANDALNLDSSACSNFNSATVNNVISNDAILVQPVGSQTSFTVLRNAVEIDNDFKGNNNGLCESNEDCIFAPHIGAYQGGGSLSTGYCTINNSVTGVRIFKYTTD